MKFKPLFIAAALTLASVSAQAGIMYQWQGVKKESPSHFYLSMEFDEATVASGSFSLYIEPDLTAAIGPIHDSGLLAFNTPYFSYRPRVDPFNLGMHFGHLDMNIQFIEGKFITGSIRYFDFQTEINLGHAYGTPERLWTIFEANADYGMGDCAGPTGIICRGGTGHIRQVPEPGSIALLGLGAITAFVARRRKATARA